VRNVIHCSVEGKRGQEAQKGDRTMGEKVTIGIDLGDKSHCYCMLNDVGEVVMEGEVSSTRGALKRMFSRMTRARIAIEAGSQSAWVSRQLEAWGHEVLVGNPRKLRMIYASDQKTDERDAEMLARIARFDPKLLSPIQHRGEQAQCDLAILKARDILVRARTDLINHVRGTVKCVGERVPKSSTRYFHKKAAKAIPEKLRPALDPILTIIGELNSKIRAYDYLVEQRCKERYPETIGLRAIKGVGPVTSLGFVLTLEDPTRFAKSRSVPVHLGLIPRKDQSGETDKQLRITKAGNKYLRRLLVGSAQYILGPFGEDCALRQFGERIAAGGGKNAKKRAAVAVARKLAVVMHHLWITGETYERFPGSSTLGTTQEQIQQKAA
jgi:transposase